MTEALKYDPKAQTIGDMRELKKQAKERMGLDWKATMDALGEGDPDVLALAVYVTMHRLDPSVTPERADAIAMVDVAADEKKADQSEQDPTDAAG